MAAVSKEEAMAKPQPMIKPEVIPIVEEPRMLPVADGEDQQAIMEQFQVE